MTPQERRRGRDGVTDCWHHGPEPVSDDTYIVCFECGHAWTRGGLEQANYRGQLEMADHPLIPPWTLDEPPFLPTRKTAEDIGFCPECIHDF